MIQFLSLAKDGSIFAQGGLYENLEDLAKEPYLFKTFKGARSIASGYNLLAKHATADILCFIHDDARLHFDFCDAIEKYFDGLRDVGVLGFVGCARMAYDSRWWLGAPLYGSLVQGPFPPEDGPNLCFDVPRQVSGTVDPAYGAQYRWEPVDSVDGYCMFIRRSVFEKIGGFDERFDAWHCYDADLCMSALKAGYQNYVIGQTSQHFSGGTLADPWARENAKWISKWLPFLKAR